MRRKRHANSESAESDIDLTPMLDVVFIMLIFFVVTTSFIKESGVEVNQPQADTAQQQEQANILIAIRPNGEIWIDGRAVDVRAVRANVERLRAEFPEGQVVVQGDRAAQIGLLVKVMDQVRLAGIMNVAIAADQGD
ncbi:ExbD/TolR family protein [Thiohalomonas denitrificans]|uniref:ExbD/TolR family protein n=1 Tax=Thiohalomonas denitrificans TaxID=415747 RepID=UPI0026E9F6CD|nr:biopolymer transporter ExbD [Thiohalomonas denitrificans]